MEVIEIIAALILCVPIAIAVDKYDNEKNMSKFFVSIVIFPACLMILVAVKLPNKGKPCAEKQKYELIQEPVYRKIK